MTRFVVPGAPRQKKNAGAIVFVGQRCRGCNRGRFPKLIPAKPWARWKADAAKTVRLWAPPETVLEPVHCRAFFYRDTARRVDAHNLYEGLADLLVDTGVLGDDDQIVSWDGSRLFIDRKNPRTEVELVPAT